ncbi:inosine-guanosine kinase [Klebsiella pneumoniae]|nr:inosine-guanosine kinase [Klebsiella pneumoniae]
MKFPGKRKSKHYFPVNARDPLLQQIQPENESSVSWVVGIDQTLVDIEAKVDEAFIVRYGLSAGHSLVIEDDVAEALYQELVRNNLITHQLPAAPSAIPCTTTRCWRTIARCCLA